MSVVDERVMQMKFDNSNFEKNISASLKTLEVFKKALNFNSVISGLSTVSSIISKTFAFDGVTSSLQMVGSKFGALESIAFGFFTRIGNLAYDTGKRIVSALTIDPIKTGYQEYETQINAIQTILANTSNAGTTLEDVNKTLDDLNAYADRTIYNFTQMTKNIGTFTAAGIDLNTSAKAIKGIANLAAVSGSTSEQASRAMYQLSQALAAGRVTLQDWNSVVNAGMGGKIFQDALMETAEVMGIAVDRTKNFRESISSRSGDSWLTSEVLIKTLERFTGDMTEAELASQGYSKSQIKAIIEMGKTANDAATEVKTFKQLWETMTEFAQSGWTQSWEYVIGDFEEAKKLLTWISKAFESILGPSIEARNNILKFWHDMGGREKLINSLKNAFHALETNILPISRALDAILPSISGQKLMRATVLIEDLTKKLKLPEKELGKVETILKGVFSIIDIIRMLIESAINMALPKVQGLTSVIDDVLSRLTDVSRKIIDIRDEIKSRKVTDSIFSKLSSGISWIITTLPNLSGRFKNLISSIKSDFYGIYDYVKGVLEKLSGPFTYFINLRGLRDILIGFSNIVESVIYNLQPLKNIFKGLFEMPELSGSKLKKASSSFLAFTKTLKFSTKTMLRLEAIGKGFIAFIGLIAEAIKSVGKVLSPIIKTISGGAISSLSELGDTFLSFGAKVGSYFVRLLDDVKKNDSITNSLFDFYNKVKTFFSEMFTIVNETVKEATGLDLKTLFNDTIGWFVSKFEIAQNALEGIFDRGVIANIFDFLMREIPIVFKHIANIVPGLFDIVKKVGGAVSDIWAALIGENTEDAANGVNLLSSALLVISALDLRKTVKELPDTIQNITKAFTTLPSTITNVANSISGFFDAMKKNTEQKTMQGIATSLLELAIAMFLLSTIDVPHIIAAFGAIEGLLYSLVGAFKSLATVTSAKDALKTMGLLSGAMLSIARGVLILSIAVAILAKLDIGHMWSAVGAIVVLMSSMLAIAYFIPKFMKFGTAADALKKASLGFVLIAVAVLIMASAVKKLAKLDIGRMWSAVGAIVALTAALVLASRFAENNLGAVFGILLLSVAVLIVSRAVKKLSEADTTSMWNAVIALSVLMLVMTGLADIAKNDLGGIISILIMAVAAKIISSSIESLAELDTKKVWNAVMALGAIMLIMTLLAMIAKADFMSVVGIFVIAAAVIIFAGAILIIANALTILSQINLGSMAVAVGALIVIVGILAVLSAIAVAFPEIIPVMLAIAGVMLVWGAAIFLVGAGLMMVALALSIFAVAYTGAAVGIITIAQSIATAIPIIVNGIINGLIALIEGLSRIYPLIPPFISSVINVAIETIFYVLPTALMSIIDYLGMFWDEHGDEIMEGLKKAWDAFWTWISENLPIWWENFKKDWSSGWNDIVNQVSEWWNDFWDKWKDGWNEIKDVWNEFWTKVAEKFVGAVEEFKDNWKSGGEQIINGIKEGLEWAWEHTLVGQVVDIAKGIFKLFNDEEEIHSPSKKFEYSGKMLMAGLQSGIEKNSDLVTDSLSDVSKSMASVFTPELFDAVRNTMNDAIPPILVPDIDTSNINNGIDTIRSNFYDESFKMADVNGKLVADTLQYRLDNEDAKIYNDSNVISAVDRLNSRLDSLSKSMADTNVYLDSGALVGAMAGPINSELGRMSNRNNRGGGR